MLRDQLNLAHEKKTWKRRN